MSDDIPFKMVDVVIVGAGFTGLRAFRMREANLSAQVLQTGTCVGVSGSRTAIPAPAATSISEDLQQD